MAGREASGRSGAYGGGSDEAGMEDRRGSNLPLFLDQGLRYLARRPVSARHGSPGHNRKHISKCHTRSALHSQSNMNHTPHTDMPHNHTATS